MKNDPAYVEHIARDQLNMGKPGETIIRFDRYQTVARVRQAGPRPADDDSN